MAVITPLTNAAPGYHPITQTYGTSAANSADTLTGDIVGLRRLKYVTCAYSAAPTQAGVVISIVSGLGAAYSAPLQTGSANAQYTSYVPGENVIYLLPGDAVKVAAPAGGGVITSSIVIVTEAV